MNVHTKSKAKILLFGATGQVGHDLVPLLSGFDLYAPGRQQLDLCQSESIRESVRAFLPNVIINAAAYTAVDKAEREPELAALVNATAPGVVAVEAARLGALLIHYSTDYVFDGSKSSSYVETDVVHPLNAYGRTKAEGERAVQASGCEYLILRTSWVFSERGSNFVRTILRLALEREELRVVDDQVGSPTSSRSLAWATERLLNQWLTRGSNLRDCVGIYHLAASGYVSWFDFAKEIVHRGQCAGVKRVIPISTDEYPTPARRPLNSRLDCSKIGGSFGIYMPTWREELRNVLKLLV